MNKLLLTLGIAVSIGGFVFLNYTTNYNYGNKAENTIKAEYSNLKNILGQYSIKVSEAAQIPAMQRDDVTQVIESALSARYGSDGSRAMFQWIQEQNPSLDPKVYLELQNIIVAGRNEYQNSQTKFIDTKRVYETNLGYLWKGFWLKVAGYPKIDLDSYKIVVAIDTEQKFLDGVDSGLKLR
jgi:hypothetical protein